MQKVSNKGYWRRCINTRTLEFGCALEFPRELWKLLASRPITPEPLGWGAAEYCCSSPGTPATTGAENQGTFRPTVAVRAQATCSASLSSQGADLPPSRASQRENEGKREPREAVCEMPVALTGSLRCLSVHFLLQIPEGWLETSGSFQHSGSPSE